MNRTYDDWKTTDTNDTGSVEDSCGVDCQGCPDCTILLPNGDQAKDDRKAKMGPLAATAQMLSEMFPGFDADYWKDSMKDQGF